MKRISTQSFFVVIFFYYSINIFICLELKRGQSFNPKALEFSIRLKECGRVILHTTKCETFCKSKSLLVPGKSLQKIVYYSSRPIEYLNITYNVMCHNGAQRVIQLKAVGSCACIENSSRILPIKYPKISLEHLEFLIKFGMSKKKQ